MSFCYSPWSNVDISVSGLIKPCCRFNYKEDEKLSLYNSTINEYKTSNFLSNLKNDFLNGVKNEGCRKCWDQEINGVPSKRILDNNRWESMYAEYNLDESVTKITSLAMGNVCNLKCRICGSDSSSKWIKEESTYKNTTSKVHDFFKEGVGFLDQVKLLLNDIVHIDFPGGEPLLTGNNIQLEILDEIISAGRADQVSLHYTTNLSVYPAQKFWSRWKYFKNVDLQFSIDGTTTHFEYNRHPANWETCFRHLKQYQTMGFTEHNIQISIAHTLSVFTVYYLPEFFNWCIKQGLPKPYISRLHYPRHYRVGVFPAHSKQLIKDKLLEHPVNDVSNWANEVFINDASNYLPEFWDWTTKVDNYRNEHFEDVYPELVPMLAL